MSVAFAGGISYKVISLAERVSGKVKFGAFVPNGSILDSV
jgi:hypothetical protein